MYETNNNSLICPKLLVTKNIKKVEKMKPNILALIPARGGSKGLPRKNILPLAGKPLIAWTIEQALESKYIDKVVVSTEDKEISDISKKYGAEVPFIRPEELASDEAKTMDVIIHALNWFENRGEHFDILVLLEPTSPLRDANDIDCCITTLLENVKAKAVVSVTKLEGSHPEFNVIINEENFIRKADGSSDFKVLRRQELDDIYYFEGSVYVSYVDTLKKFKSFYHELTMPYIVPRYKAFEVDELCDLICIEALINARKRGIL